MVDGYSLAVENVTADPGAVGRNPPLYVTLDERQMNAGVSPNHSWVMRLVSLTNTSRGLLENGDIAHPIVVYGFNIELLHQWDISVTVVGFSFIQRVFSINEILAS